MSYIVTIGGLINYCNMLLAFQNECLIALKSSGQPPERIIMPADEKEKIETALKEAQTRLAILNNFILTNGTEISEVQARSFFGKDFEVLLENGKKQGKSIILT
jgi:hypothetical protein